MGESTSIKNSNRCMKTTQNKEVKQGSLIFVKTSTLSLASRYGKPATPDLFSYFRNDLECWLYNQHALVILCLIVYKETTSGK